MKWKIGFTPIQKFTTIYTYNEKFNFFLINFVLDMVFDMNFLCHVILSLENEIKYFIFKLHGKIEHTK